MTMSGDGGPLVKCTVKKDGSSGDPTVVPVPLGLTSDWTLTVPRPTSPGSYVVMVENAKQVKDSRPYTVS
jgi:hypothetical protein